MFDDFEDGDVELNAERMFGADERLSGFYDDDSRESQDDDDRDVWGGDDMSEYDDEDFDSMEYDFADEDDGRYDDDGIY